VDTRLLGWFQRLADGIPLFVAAAFCVMVYFAFRGASTKALLSDFWSRIKRR
jgi:hypothetical protein